MTEKTKTTTERTLEIRIIDLEEKTVMLETLIKNIQETMKVMISYMAPEALLTFDNKKIEDKEHNIIFKIKEL